MNKYFYLLASLCLAAFFGCQNDNDMNASFSKEKGTISATIDSVGKVHNYLLEQMKDSEIGLCISNKTKMKDLVNCFQRLNDNGKYCYNEIMTRADNDNADFSEFENNKNINHMCHSFRRGTMQMYQIREANSGGKSKKVVVYIIQKGLNHYISIIYKIIIQLKK